MELTERQHKLLEFTRKKHEGQQRKYTGEPYINHPLSVAQIVSKHMLDEGAIEIAICHDLLEDTDCTSKGLYNQLLWIGYSEIETKRIVFCVNELTDEYTHENYPDLNREKRKQFEAERLGETSHLVQSIKYADFIDNTSSIVKYDKGFAKVYLQEKKAILDKMRNGNIDLLIECCYTLKMALKELE